ncbi:MAG TPA: T9SS type A sorting domain-containing protein [Paludibacter sp.]
MKRRLLFTLMLTIFLGLSITKSQSQSNLILRFTDGSEKGSALSSLTKITFSGTNMLLSYTDGTTGTFDESSVSKMIFGVVSAVGPVVGNDSKLVLYPNPATDYISVKNAAEEAMNYTIYGLDGAALISSNLLSASQQIDISALKKGFYVIKVNNQAMKFLKL